MAELQWVAGKVGSWFTAANWSPAKVPHCRGRRVVIDGASSLAEIDDATGLADNVTVGAGAELEVGTGGVLDATNAITVDGFAAELLVEERRRSRERQQQRPQYRRGHPELQRPAANWCSPGRGDHQAGDGRAQRGSFVARLRDDRQLHFRQRNHGSRGRGASRAGNRHLDRRRHLLRRHVHRGRDAADWRWREDCLARQPARSSTTEPWRST